MHGSNEYALEETTESVQPAPWRTRGKTPNDIIGAFHATSGGVQETWARLQPKCMNSKTGLHAIVSWDQLPFHVEQ